MSHELFEDVEITLPYEKNENNKLVKYSSKKMHKSGSIKLKVFPSVPVTSKPAEVRMGKGKGSLKYWCFPVTPGRLLLEFQGVSQPLAVEINKLVNSKLPIITKLVEFL